MSLILFLVVSSLHVVYPTTTLQLQNVCRTLYIPPYVEKVVEDGSPAVLLPSRATLRGACRPGRGSNPLRYVLSKVFFDEPLEVEETRNGVFQTTDLASVRRSRDVPHGQKNPTRRLHSEHLPESVPPAWVRRWLAERVGRYYAVLVAQRIGTSVRKSEQPEPGFLSDIVGALGGDESGIEGRVERAKAAFERVIVTPAAKLSSADAAKNGFSVHPNFLPNNDGHIEFVSQQRFGSWRHPAFCARDLAAWVDLRRDWVWAVGTRTTTILVEHDSSTPAHAQHTRPEEQHESLHARTIVWSQLHFLSVRCEAQLGTLYEARVVVSRSALPAPWRTAPSSVGTISHAM